MLKKARNKHHAQNLMTYSVDCDILENNKIKMECLKGRIVRSKESPTHTRLWKYHIAFALEEVDRIFILSVVDSEAGSEEVLITLWIKRSVLMAFN